MWSLTTDVWKGILRRQDTWYAGRLDGIHGIQCMASGMTGLGIEGAISLAVSATKTNTSDCGLLTIQTKALMQLIFGQYLSIT